MGLNLAAFVISCLVMVTGTAFLARSDFIAGDTEKGTDEDETLVSEKSRFYCELQADPSQGGEVWSVVYRHEKGRKPWLRMVQEMGGGWDTQKRCNKIAENLNLYREDGLKEFTYRTDPNTPKQYVICAKTKISGNNCPQVLTLMPDDDPYQALRNVAGALVPGSLPTYQCNDPNNCPPIEDFSISVEDQPVSYTHLTLPTILLV